MRVARLEGFRQLSVTTSFKLTLISAGHKSLRSILAKDNDVS